MTEYWFIYSSFERYNNNGGACFQNLLGFSKGRADLMKQSADGVAREAAITYNYGEEKVFVMSAIS